ncbi:DUF1877 family protein [Corynebacterium freneyi]|uniref:DUF1877 family protein n=1 Tax=Corynebacterium freneyi TaxID=134034 RepID=UPI00254A24B5|nr:DUF1877 family protein [Corynebacterium freneyi]MDK8769152.1 DUF1877 family protein [Corynebacterium freneyi]
MPMGMCAEYLRLGDEEIAELRTLADAGDDRATGKVIFGHFEAIADHAAFDLDTVWENVLLALTGNPLDGQTVGDPLGEAVLGGDRVCRQPLTSVLEPGRVREIADALETVDFGARMGDNGVASSLSDDDAADLRRRFSDFAAFYRGAADAGSAVLVTIA